ncbi:ATP-dependent RNA helicase-like protein rok1 [Phyllosticta citribraziliensis]|uniref:ATP-dependent RNA helicase ROK1 n=1 Tax=Phyllosticta citribraziliensis TaxID=989973 RepID=A0ABR1M0J0_9PEZI
MDFLKILSRGTSVSKGAAKATPTQQTPSSGATSNPQLFGLDTATQTAQDPTKTGSKKRKRTRAAVTPAIDLPPELDFFGDANHAKTVGTEEADDQKADEGTDNVEKVEEVKDNSQPLDEEECKRILRSHKVKITVLEDYNKAKQEHMDAERKSKKRKKSKESVEAPPKKKSKDQLYPEPLTSFKQLRSRHGISRRLAENIEAQGYTMPTEVQLASLPLLLHGTAPESNGIDLLTVAPTGSGKTLAFLIPLLHSLLHQRHDQESKLGKNGIQAIVLAPTKELASQIANEGRKMSLNTGVKVSLMRKGMEVVEEDAEQDEVSENFKASASDSDSGSEDESAPKSARRKRGQLVKSDIIVSTPLALLHALKQSNGSVAPLKSARHLVLDEADVLLDPLFREQTLDIWNALTNPHLRVSLWSATMGSSIEELAVNTINSRWSSIASEAVTRPNLIRLIVGLKDSAVPNIHHQLTYAATEQGKLLAVRQLLHPTAPRSLDPADTPSLRPPFLIFTQTIPRAQALHSELQYDIPPEAGGSSRIAVLHSSLSSKQRDSVMTRFRRGEVWVLITTDLLARGVDFRGINGVVNYDAPTSGAAYVHRVGRTGRAGRAGGVAVTLYTEEDIPYIKNIANVIRRAEQVRGVDEQNSCVKQWLLDALPTPSKRDKKELKRRGVEARRAGVEGERTRGKWRTQISTRSGFEKRSERNRREAVEASKKRKIEGKGDADAGSGSEFGGFD